MYGPKGIGALYVRRKPRVRLDPIISGGGQERGLRSGTLPVPLIVGFGRAAEVAGEEMESDLRHVTRLFYKLHDGIRAQLPDVYLNGDATQRYFGNLNLSFAYVEGESLLMGLKVWGEASVKKCAKDCERKKGQREEYADILVRTSNRNQSPLSQVSLTLSPASSLL